MENVLSFLTGYHVVLLATLLTFAPLHTFRKYGWLRLMVLGTAYLLIPEAYNQWSGEYFWIAPFFDLAPWYSISFFLYWFFAMLLFYVSFQCAVGQVLFYGAAAYSMQWLCVNLQTILRYILFGGERNLFTRIFSVLLISLLLTLFHLFLVRRLRQSDQVSIRSHQLLFFLIATLFSVNVFTQAWQHSYISNDEFDNVEIYGTVFSAVIAVLLLVVQFGLFEQGKLRQEKTVINQMLQNAQKQYELSKQNIDVINRKCHDMRHQINALRTITDERERKALFSETESAIRIYSTIAKTGNEALDVVLTEKSLLCEDNGITLGYLLNGTDFAFMETVDIYSLFGNALDNAIEAVMQCPDENKRIISVRAQKKGEFLNLTVENYCERQIDFTDGLPITSKADKDYHGFGTKSMKYIVEKYGGSMKMQQEGDRFIVRAFFTV